MLNDSDIPARQMEAFKTEQGDIMLDRLWHHIGNIKNADGTWRFERLRKVVRLILTIPHSNAEEERIFSIIRKNKTCFRPNLDPSETLGSIVTVKLAMESEPVTSIVLPDKVLASAKEATMKYNKLHSKKGVAPTSKTS